MADALTFDDLVPGQGQGMPAAGYLPGKVHLDPKLAPDVADGEPRPFAPGEFVSNPDGSWSSEISMSVAHPRLNGGKPTNIPSLWVVGGKAYRAKNEDEAATLASQSGLTWPTFPDMAAADKAAADREKQWQGIVPEKASAIPPLYRAGSALTPEEQAYKDENPDITDAQARYAVANARLRDAGSEEGQDPTNPAYDRPGKVGDDTLYRVLPTGQLAVPLATFDDLVPKKVSPLADIGLSGLSGLTDSVSNLADEANPIRGALESARKTASKVGGIVEAVTGVKQHDPLPEIGFNALVRPDLHAPQTTAGRYAHTIGEFAPAAVGGEGGILARGANALLPAIASQAAGDVAHDVGASPGVERAVRIGGALAGGAGSSLRFNPGEASALSDVAAPTLEKLTAAKTAAYDAAHDADVRFKPDAFKDLLTTMANRMDDAGFGAGLHKKAAEMIAQIGASARGAEGGYSPTLGEVDKVRQQIGRDVASSPDPGEQRMGAIMRGAIDDFVNNATADHVTSNVDPKEAATILNTARDLNTRVEKLKALDNLDEAAADRAGATGTGGNIGNATRQNVIRFQNQVDNLTPDEQAQVTRIIRGSGAGNALRAVGALSPEGGTVRAGLSIATGAMSHGIIPGAGYVAKRASDALTARQVQELRDLIANGGSKGTRGAVANALRPQSLITAADPMVDYLAPTALLSVPASETATTRAR